jgi:glyoxylase-like metal-dependent hydrolase (beta-lactamase superfamily II)
VKIDRVLAPNPGPYTGPGTNTYVVADAGRSVVIDPGPIIASHLGAIEHALGDSAPVAVLVTHTHPDHAPAANPLARRLGVPALGFAPGPEFVPDSTLADGDIVEVGAAALTVVHTPGHTPDHICLLSDGVLFTGDHIIGGSTVIIEDAADYITSLRRVRDLEPHHLCPGHGDEIPEAVAMVDAYIAHREQREREIVDAVATGADSIQDIVSAVYAGLDASLVPAAIHQVGIQLQKLHAERRVELRPGSGGEADTVLLPGISP